MRYFICFYYGHLTNSKEAYGTCALTSEKGKYLNRDYAENYIKDLMKLTKITLTNIIEINEGEFNEFIR